MRIRKSGCGRYRLSLKPERALPGTVCLMAMALLSALAFGCVEEYPQEAPGLSLTLSRPVEYLGPVSIREPMVAEHPDGALFVAGFTQAIEESQRPPKLHKSVDAGVTWTAVDVWTPTPGAAGNSDVDLAVGTDGTLYFLTMGFDRSRSEGTHIAVGVSQDIGETWGWTTLSHDRFVDRPWIEVGPDGVVHVIWNDGKGVSYSVSRDSGGTWTERPRINPQGGSSHLAVGPGGEIAVRITPISASGNQYDEGVDLLVVSVDGGNTWEKMTPPGNRSWSSDPLPRWVEPVAWDAEGTLYHLWSEGSDLWLGRSVDRGDTWESWVVVTGEGSLYFPYLTARGQGELAATWFSGFGENLMAHVALIAAKGGGQPSVKEADPFQIDTWVLDGDSPTRDSGGEYIPVRFLSDGDLGVVAPIQNPRENRRGFAWYRVSY